MGKVANDVKAMIEQLITPVWRKCKRSSCEKNLLSQALDVTLPSRLPERGHKHPLTQVLEDVEEIFHGLGFPWRRGLKPSSTTITLKR